VVEAEGDLEDREREVITVDHDAARSSAVTAQQKDEDPAHRNRADRAQRYVPYDRPAARDQAGSTRMATAPNEPTW
jgi:hypothetical protein